MNTTTRRYPRSLAEAFPDERAYCIERPRRVYDYTHAGHRLVAALALVGVCAFIVFGFTGRLE